MWAGESAFMVALGVLAFRDGGVAAVGVVTAARMVPAALLAPFLATMADRVRRERVLVCVGVVRAAMLGCAAVMTAAGAPAAGTYGSAVIATVAMTLFESEEAMRRGDEVLNSMSPGGTERRTSVEFFEVPVQTVT